MKFDDISDRSKISWTITRLLTPAFLSRKPVRTIAQQIFSNDPYLENEFYDGQRMRMTQSVFKNGQKDKLNLGHQTLKDYG